jgi:hypothetical protein
VQQRIFDDLEAAVADFMTIARQPPADGADLARNIASIYHRLEAADFSAYDVAAVRAAAPRIVSSLFDLRMDLRDRIPGWHAEGLMTRDVQKALRDVFRAARYASDMVGEIMIGHQRLPEEGRTHRAFSSPQFNTLAHRRHGNGQPIAFRSGDVYLMRGRHHNSAAIARIGDIDSQFSHAGMIYVDAQGRHWAVESLIEEGALVTPLAEALAHDMARAVILRPRDAALAHAAAAFVHERIERSRKAFHRRIHYDFSMTLEPYSRLYCSKLVRYAFDKASSGAVKLPTFTTRLDGQNRDFYDRIGVTAAETFAPGDLEIEPSFDFVAEWQDWRVTHGTRLQDLLMTKIFEWMEAYGYRFEETWAVSLIGTLGRLSAYLSDEAKQLVSSVVPKVPVSMKRRTIATIAMLHKTAEPLYRDLLELEDMTVATTGRPLHPAQVYEYLEGVRAGAGGRIGYLVAGR